MKEYHKIQSMFKRDKETKRMLFGQWTCPEFEYLQNNPWQFTEKVDGTNIRVIFDGERIMFKGKTDNAQMPPGLLDRLHELFDSKIETFKTIFSKDGVVFPACLYGEGYGAGIQKGGCYKQTKDFVLFDTLINEYYLLRPAVEDIATKLGIDIVPLVGTGTLRDGIAMVKAGYKSAWGDFLAEGIVARPAIELNMRNGHRIITKIKHIDFKE